MPPKYFRVTIGLWRSTYVDVTARDEEDAIAQAKLATPEDDTWYDNDPEYEVEEISEEEVETS